MSTVPVGVVGLSHLGVVTSIGLASHGYTVTGVDADALTVDRLTAGDCIFPEPGLPEMLVAHRSNLTFTTDFNQLNTCDTVLFGEDTIITSANEMDLSRIHMLLDALIPHIKQGASLLMMSQVPVGFTRALLQKINTLRPDLQFHLYYWVDVLVVGDAVHRFEQPGRIIIGHQTLPAEPMAEAIQALFASFNCPILHMNYESAEITKSAVNVYLATTVTFANALSDLCEAAGADMTQIIPALRLDKRIGQFAYIKPGLGFSGGHLERDLVALTHLAEKYHVDSHLIDLIQTESDRRYDWLVKNIEAIFAKNPSPTIALWGLSYKKNTDSTHGAPSLKVIADFASRAKLVAFDPLVRLPDASIAAVTDPYEALAGADGLVILSDWDVFKTLDAERLKQVMRTPVVIDPLGVVSDLYLSEKGITYIPMGRA